MLTNQADITQMTSGFAEIIPPYHRRGNRIPFAAIRWPDFGDQPSVGSPFAQFFRHPDTPLLSFSPRRRCPRPTPRPGHAVDRRGPCRHQTGCLEQSDGALRDGGIKLSIGEQTGVSSDPGPVELQLQTAVKIDPKAPLFRLGVIYLTERRSTPILGSWR